MSAAVDTPSEPLTRFDSASAVEPGDAVPPTKKTNARRKSSVAFTQDTAIDETGEGSPVQTTMKARRKSSVAAPDVYNMEDLRQAFDDAPADEKEAKKLRIAPETQKLGWKLNTPPSSVEDKDALDKLLCFPKLKKVQLHFPHGLGVTARNSKGVTIRDALDAIYKQFKKRADDELENPYLKGFEFDETDWTQLIVHQKSTSDPSSPMSKKKKAKAEEEGETR